jgi:serine phosphatase RsbU (regulator of sigma subunit)/anti-sigma regulatory factor (Ser/Thr protein kinase)
MARTADDGSMPERSSFEDLWGRESLRFRHRLWAVACAAIVVLAGVAVALAWRQYQDAQDRALNDAHGRVVLAASLLDSYFGGRVATLNAVAAAPALVSLHRPAMEAYFRRVAFTGASPFNGGIGWTDLSGNTRVSSNPSDRPVNVADRSYFKQVIATGKPFVSEGLTSRARHQQIIVIAVPTKNARGRKTGVLAGALLVTPAQNDTSAAELGFEGLQILDRADQSVYERLARPKETELVARIRAQRDGTFSDTNGLDGSSGHVVAFATSVVPQWKIVIDRPRSEVFGAARRSLALELGSIGAAGLAIIALFGWILLRTRREDRREGERVRQWSELTHTLGGASAAKDVSDALVAAMAASFPAAQALVALEVENRLGLVVGDPPSGIPQPIAGADEFVLLQVAKLAYSARSPIVVENEASLLERYPRIHAALRGNVRSFYAEPLVVRDGRRVGALTLLFADERTLSDAERSLVAAQAEQAAQALVRAATFEREHEVAIRLQRSLLSEQLLDSPEIVDVAARYNAGSAGLEVGGDWYDAVRRPDGIIHFSVGDVAGHGIVAAALMGQLRNAFRAYAYDQTSPAEIVRRLTRHIGDDEMATTVCIAVDPYTRELAYASAGHPPSLLVDGRTGAMTRLSEGSSPPLGFAEPGSVTETCLMLPIKATLVGYTDGLVERRDTGIESGIQLLESLVESGSGLDANGLADMVLGEIAALRAAEDDIALLVAQFSEVPSRMQIELPADPTTLAGMRRRLQAWLTLRGLSEDERADIVLAVSEACNNAVEHAYAQNPGTIELVLEHHAELLEITVRDFGIWRPVQPSYERGRGTSIMKILMDDAEVSHDHRGTHVTLARKLTRTP